jgi:lipopolysaccharide heptosyltransferase I
VWRPPSGRPARILLVRLSALGDVLHALPVLTGLRSLLPDAEVDWAVEDRAAGLLTRRKDLRRVVVLPRRALASARAAPLAAGGAAVGLAASFVATLRAGGYDVAIDLQGNLKSGVVTRLSGAGLRYGLPRAASREGNHLFLQRTARGALAVHRVERSLALVSRLLGREVPYVPPGFPTAASDAEDAREALGRAGVRGTGYVVLHAGTSGFGSFKRWPEDRWADLAVRLGAAGDVPVLTCSPAERAATERIARLSEGAARVVETSSLPALAEVLRGARQVVAADTGPLHLAALLDVPVLGLFGPKDPRVYGPYGLRTDGTPGPLPVLVREDVACRPCTLRRCADPLCMRTLDPADVARRVARPLRA